MNRPLKFRVWDSTINQYLQNDQDNPYLYYKLGISYNLSDIMFFYARSENSKWVVQQYTGLKDKNGKEIYEGDIIRAMHDFGPAGFRSHISAVKWDKEVGYQWEYWDLSTIEIIGNIFETKNCFNEIPQEVKNAAVFLGDYFKKQGIDNWTLYDVSSRK